jgi:hypothetical protein
LLDRNARARFSKSVRRQAAVAFCFVLFVQRKVSGMYHLPQRGGPVRKSLRPPLDLVERRRQERLVEGQAWWPSGKVVRVAAASIVAGLCCSAFAGLALAAGTGTSLTSAAVDDVPQPADAATLPAPFVPERASRAHALRSTRIAHRMHLARSVTTHRSIAIADPTTPTSAPPASPTPGAAVDTYTVATPPAQPASPLSASPWKLTADGMWTTTVSLALPAGVDASNLEVDWSSDAADVLPLDPNAPGAPGAIVTASENAEFSVVASSSNAAIGRQSIALAAPSISNLQFSATAQPIGARLVDVGWMHLPDDGNVTEYKVYRRRAGAVHGQLLATISPAGRSWRDDSVSPASAYIYTVVASRPAYPYSASTGFVTTGTALTSTTLSAISGKGMFLYFTPDAGGENSYLKYDPAAVISRAQTSGISHIEVRMARGTFAEAATPASRAWLDELIDRASAAGIRLIAWQVPRRSTTADAAAAVAAAEYTTPSGNGFSGISLDIEDGDNYMGNGDIAKQRMVDQIALVREAVGPDYLVVATVMSPALTHWTNARYPFSGIATYASVMQPMEYWHHFYTSKHHSYTQDEVSGACADSVSLTRQQAGRDIPINVAGQSDDLGTTGRPSSDEIGWCLAGAKGAGAIGQTFFDWRGTGDDGWSAIADFAW